MHIHTRRIAGSFANSLLAFVGASILFLQLVTNIQVPNGVRGFSLLYTLAHICGLLFCLITAIQTDKRSFALSSKLRMSMNFSYTS